MLFVDIPAQLNSHRTEVVAVHPVLYGVVLVIVAVAKGKNDLPKGFQIGILFRDLFRALCKVVVGTAKLGHMLYACGDKEHFFGVGAEIQVFLMIENPCGVFCVYTRMLEKIVLTVVAVEELTIAEIEAGL